ncbi:MAG: radical SAM protein [Deltaproteobacteria bacterium]|nr:radical SAM protein [Deltaproteobacteria bacterium]
MKNPDDSLDRFSAISRVASGLISARLFTRHPLVLLHAVTEACNARCPYCVFRHGKQCSDELSMEEISVLYLEARMLGVQYVHLWGGEPLVHPRIADIAREAKKNRLMVGLVTNGALLERKCEEVLPWVDRVYVSLDHPTPKHDEMRATPGLFEAALRGIRKVRALRPRQIIVVSFTLYRENADAVEDMVKLCREMDLRVYVNPMRAAANSAGDAPAAHNERVFEVDNADLLIPWEEQREVWNRLIELKRDRYPIQNTIPYMRKIARTGKKPSYRCHWPKIAVSVDANGDVVDCQRWDQPIANLRTTSLAEALCLPRSRELCGEVGESCNACVSPARVEPSGIWGLKPNMIAHSFQTLALRRPGRPKRKGGRKRKAKREARQRKAS